MIGWPMDNWIKISILDNQFVFSRFVSNMAVHWWSNGVSRSSKTQTFWNNLRKSFCKFTHDFEVIFPKLMMVHNGRRHFVADVQLILFSVFWIVFLDENADFFAGKLRADPELQNVHKDAVKEHKIHPPGVRGVTKKTFHRKDVYISRLKAKNSQCLQLRNVHLLFCQRHGRSSAKLTNSLSRN